MQYPSYLKFKIREAQTTFLQHGSRIKILKCSKSRKELVFGTRAPENATCIMRLEKMRPFQALRDAASGRKSLWARARSSCFYELPQTCPTRSRFNTFSISQREGLSTKNCTEERAIFPKELLKTKKLWVQAIFFKEHLRNSPSI